MWLPLHTHHPRPPNPQAGLIGQAKETAKDGAARAQLHRRWEEQQDAKEVQEVVRAMRNGFKRKHGAGFLGDDEVRW